MIVSVPGLIWARDSSSADRGRPSVRSLPQSGTDCKPSRLSCARAYPGRLAPPWARAARQSADDKQFIGCAAYGATSSSAPTYVACSASDASGTAVYCATYNPSYYVWLSAMAVNEVSSIIFNVDANYNCTYIYVSNNSTNL